MEEGKRQSITEGLICMPSGHMHEDYLSNATTRTIAKGKEKSCFVIRSMQYHFVYLRYLAIT